MAAFPEELHPPAQDDPVTHEQIVVIPYHQHDRVTGKEQLFEQPWGVEQVLAVVYGQMISQNLLPERRFLPGDEQWMYASVPSKQVVRVLATLEARFRKLNLPVLAFSQRRAPGKSASCA